ncbi:MAG: hypothetical protein ACYC96_13865 [Fimbriimonadaceae bacterium]
MAPSASEVAMEWLHEEPYQPVASSVVAFQIAQLGRRGVAAPRRAELRQSVQGCGVRRRERAFDAPRRRHAAELPRPLRGRERGEPLRRETLGELWRLLAVVRPRVGFRRGALLRGESLDQPYGARLNAKRGLLARSIERSRVGVHPPVACLGAHPHGQLAARCDLSGIPVAAIAVAVPSTGVRHLVPAVAIEAAVPSTGARHPVPAVAIEAAVRPRGKEAGNERDSRVSVKVIVLTGH